MKVLLIYMNIHEGMCVMRALPRFIDRHVTRFRLVASTHFKMRHNNSNYVSECSPQCTLSVKVA